MIDAKQLEPPVAVQRHRPDLEDPGAGVWNRIDSFAENAPTCLFLNPIGTITCDKPTPEFFRAARKLQGKWCQRYKALFGRRALRSVSNWVSWKGFQSRDARYWDRAATFTGILLINDRFVPPHQWPDRNRIGQNRRNTRHRADVQIRRQSDKESIPCKVGNVREEFIFD